MTCDDASLRCDLGGLSSDRRTDADVSGYESAVEQFCTLVIERVANAEPGDVLCNVTCEELVTAMHDVLAVLPRIQWPFVVGEWIRV